MLSKNDHYKATLGAIATMLLVYHTTDLIEVFMIAYLLLDLCLFSHVLTADMVLHHVLSLLLLFSFHHRTKEEQVAFLLTEVSTPFLVLSRLGIFKNLTKICFLATFLYFRVYGVGVVLWKERYSIYDPCVWNGYALWVLNLYWLEIILRHIIDKDQIQRSFFHIFVPIASFYFLHNSILQLWVAIFIASISVLWSNPMDRAGMHFLSFVNILNTTPGNFLSFVSFPLHQLDLLLDEERFLLLSLGWDVMHVFYYTNNLMWLCAWTLMTILYVRQTFGSNTGSVLYVGTTMAICLL